MLKPLILSAAKAGGAIALARRRYRNYFRVLAFHGVERASDPLVNFDGFQVPADVFREQLRILRESYTVLPLTELIRRAAGPDPAPHAVALTFDDGYRNNLQVAAPILQEFGMPATFFVTTGFIDGTHEPWWYRLRHAVASATDPALASDQDKIKAMIRWEGELKRLQVEERDARVSQLVEQCKPAEPGPRFDMMSWEDVKALRDMGFDIGPHTVTHISLGVESPQRVQSEIALSLQRLGEQLGARPAVYSYPYGQAEDIDAALPELMKSHGVQAGVTTIEGLNKPGASPWSLRRLNVTGRHRGLAFESLVAGLTTRLRSVRHAV